MNKRASQQNDSPRSAKKPKLATGEEEIPSFRVTVTTEPIEPDTNNSRSRSRSRSRSGSPRSFRASRDYSDVDRPYYSSDDEAGEIDPK